WTIPHFEKMLYDQALLAAANVEAFQVTGNEEYARTAREIFAYVLREMTAPEGGFYSAEDADSEGEEGKFYTWTTEEVIEVLGKEEGEWYAGLFGFEGGGNWTDEATREKPGTNIPHLDGVVGAGDRARVEAARAKLFAHREERIHPQKDDKILTDWNGLMISALARGGQALGDEVYTAAAKKAADFVLETLRRKDGRLLKRYRAGDAGLTAHLEDYAFMVWGLIDLYEATFDVRYLREAVALNDSMLEHFWDDAAGGLFMTADDSEKLLVRAKKIYGGAIPSGNAVAALNLLRLARMTGKVEYEERYGQLVKAFSGDVAKSPSAFPQLLQAVDFAVGPSYEVVVVGKQGGADVAKMAGALRRPFLPSKVVVFRPDDGGEGIPEVSKIATYTETQRSLGGRATAYVCMNFACNLPTAETSKMLELLKVEE
ncbi:MAG: AGE family epimerase/isomerase, partial [Verrucomicrobiales bacterium]|nr:AGE family epimerase/isomerase [Verrucomicrobiales bacterium]